MPTSVIAEHNGADADRDAPALRVHDVHQLVNHRLPRLDGVAQGAGREADAGTEDVVALLPDGRMQMWGCESPPVPWREASEKRAIALGRRKFVSKSPT